MSLEQAIPQPGRLHTRWRRATATVLTVGTLVAGMSISTSEAETKSDSDAVLSSYFINRKLLHTLPEAPCQPTADHYSPSKNEAACAGAQSNGEIVLVDFNTNTKEVTQTIPSVKKLLANETKNIVMPEITMIPASQEARQILNAEVAKSDGCLDHTKQDKAATIADHTMPEVKRYDFVLGISPHPFCKPAAGRADYRGRHADIYTINPRTIAHEIDHLFGGHHKGQTLISTGEGDYSSISLDEEKNHLLNLQAIFKKNNYLYTEYDGVDSIMGSYQYRPGTENDVHPQPIEVDFLRKVSGRKTFVKTIGRRTSITREEEKKGAFGMVKLMKPITLSYKNYLKEDKEKRFDYLAIVPQTIQNLYNRIRNYSLYLTDGSINAEITQGDQPATIVNGQQKIEISLNDNELELSTRT